MALTVLGCCFFQHCRALLPWGHASHSEKGKLGKIVLEAQYSTVDTFFYAIDWSAASLSLQAGVHCKFAAA